MAQSDQPGITNYWQPVWQRRALVAAIVAVSVVATMIVSLLLPKYYRSEAVILAVAPESGGLGATLSASPLAGAFSGSLGGLSSPADKILVLLKSRTVAEMVVKRFDLLHVFYEKKWDAVKKEWKDPEKPPLLEDAVRTLGRDVVQFRKSKEGAISITVEWKDPKLAAEMANYFVVSLAEFMKDKSMNTTVQIVDAAVPAGRKSSPSVSKNMALAGLLSLFIAVALAVFLENRSRRN
jgi:uncharacterized protein involved in exopolysaccharide biosynthesis